MLDAGWLVIPAVPMGLGILASGLWRKASWWTVILQLVVLVHATAVVAVAFFPFPYQHEFIEGFRGIEMAHNNLIPLVSLIHAVWTGTYPSVVDQSIGNLLMLLPLGVYLPLLVPRARHLGVTASAGLAASLAIELGQLGISAILGYTYKIADVDDVILNTAGVAVGFGIYWTMSHLLSRRLTQRPLVT